MIQQMVEISHQEAQKVEEVVGNHVQDLVDRMQEVKMGLKGLLNKDKEVLKGLNRDQQLILIMIKIKITNRD